MVIGYPVVGNPLKPVAAVGMSTGFGRNDASTRNSIPRKNRETTGMITAAAYVGAAIAEIAGCFAFWAWLRLGYSVWWLVPGMLSLAAFAWLLTLADVEAAGRAYAAYGGVYIAASLVWLWSVEGLRPDRWDLAGASLCLLGMALILFGPRAAA